MPPNEEVNAQIELAKTLRDELRVQVHLAGMEAKQRFERLERRFETDQLKLQRAIKDAIVGFKALKEEVSKAPKAQK